MAYPILCLILRPTVSISGQIINIVILSDLMLRLSQKLQKQCLEAMLKCESRFMGRTWRDMEYHHRWYKTDEYEMFGKRWQISVVAKAYSGKPITEAERTSCRKFQENKQATLNLLAEKVIEFINENFDVLRFNWPAAKKIQDASELSTVLMPTSLLFKQDGTTLLLFECAWEIQMLAFPFKYIQIGKWEDKICFFKTDDLWL